MFSSTTSFKLCFNWSASEYSLSLSWWIFLGRILAKSWVVKSGFIILTCFLCWLLLEITLCSLISSALDCPQYPLKPGLADCGLQLNKAYLFIFFGIKINRKFLNCQNWNIYGYFIVQDELYPVIECNVTTAKISGRWSANRTRSCRKCSTR